MVSRFNLIPAVPLHPPLNYETPLPRDYRPRLINSYQSPKEFKIANRKTGASPVPTSMRIRSRAIVGC